MKILVIQQKKIGDVLISSLLCENLRKAYPNAHIDYLIHEYTSDVVKGREEIYNLILFKDKCRKDKWEFIKFIYQIRTNKYDIIIDAYSKLESWLIVLFSGASKRISYKKKGRSIFFTHKVNLKNNNDSLGQIINNRLALLNPLNLNISLETFPKIYVQNKEKEFTKNLFQINKINSSKKTIMINILGSKLEKCYPSNYMSNIVDFIANKVDSNILFNYEPYQINEAREIFNHCSKNSRKKIYFNVLGTNIRELIAILNNCDGVIGNDSGATNIAKSLNKPTFIIFSPCIKKQGWATFEDGDFHKSVHLEDYKPLLFKNRSKKRIKKLTFNYYKIFEPELVYEDLTTFLNKNINE